PISGFSRTPSTLVRSPILIATGSLADASVASTKSAAETAMTRRPVVQAAFIRMRLLKIQKVQDGAQHSMRRPHSVRNHTFALDFQFQIAHRVGSDRVVRPDIAPAHHSAQ